MKLLCNLHICIKNFAQASLFSFMKIRLEHQHITSVTCLFSIIRRFRIQNGYACFRSYSSSKFYYKICISQSTKTHNISNCFKNFVGLICTLKVACVSYCIFFLIFILPFPCGEFRFTLFSLFGVKFALIEWIFGNASENQT